MRAFGDAMLSNRPFGGRVLGTQGAVASNHYLSAQAGMDMLRAGGNAFDAGVAATLVESLVNPHMFTIGGECPMLLYVAAENRVVSVNGNTVAPEKSTLENYRKRDLELIPPNGVLAAGVPAAPGALIETLLRFGSLPLEQVVAPAVSLARNGFPAHEGLVGMPRFSIADNRDQFAREWPSSGAIYLKKDGTVPEAGDLIVNEAFASVLEALADASVRATGTGGRAAGLKAALDAFYRGDIAQDIARFSEERDGFLAASDLALFTTRFENPVRLDFRGATVFKCGPWCQGPVFLQLLRLLEGFDLAAMGHNTAEYLHVWVEAAKLAYADREQYYADPDHVAVPMAELLADGYTVARRELIDPQRADLTHRPGDPLRGRALLPREEVFEWKSWGFGTVHVAAADKEGNLAAFTPSGAWIAGNEVVPSLGFPLTSRLQTFYLDPRHPNAVAPFKRPRTTLTPSLAFSEDRPWMAFGTMGGDQQDQWTSQFFLNRVVFGMGLQEAIEAPKITCDHVPGTFHPHDAFPGHVWVEGRIARDVVDELSERGHRVTVAGDWSAGYICAASWSEKGLLEAGADPRGNKARVFPSQALAW